MTIQSLPLSSILPPEGNPRTAIDPAGIESLAASIQADGLLQNLVVLQLKGKKPRYRLISGERRYQALKAFRYHRRNFIRQTTSANVQQNATE
jgi:ParB family transcriptional regulator, chromosome partitioning protein